MNGIRHRVDDRVWMLIGKAIVILFFCVMAIVWGGFLLGIWLGGLP